MVEIDTVFITGGGGREAALAHAYAQSPKVKKIVCVPGNPTIDWNTNGKPVFTAPRTRTTDLREIGELIQTFRPGLVDVAQDDAVAAGVADLARSLGIPTVGPSSEAGKIESEKAWARELGRKLNLPQPVFQICNSVADGVNYLSQVPEGRFFVKASGLAAGKGALPAKSRAEAVRRIFELSQFGEAGKRYLIENWITGDDNYAEEASIFVLCDGKNYQIIGCAQDHKRALDGDHGENTGGMGCSSPPLLLRPELLEVVDREIIAKTIKGLIDQGIPYQGVLYLGAMFVHQNGEIIPKVVEFNARWGDPEAEVVVPSIQNDFYELMQSVAGNDISNVNIIKDTRYRVTVAGTSRGYPGDYSAVKGKRIFGIEDARKLSGITIYGAGINVVNDNYYANGGRLFHVVAEGKDVNEAREKAYEAMERISIEDDGLHYRRDIGYRDVQRTRRR
jgi:phosphoribosylamine---glycine ligase